MTKEEKEIHDSLINNSIIFFRDSIDKLTKKDDGTEDLISHELVILLCTSIQVSLELALKALLIKNKGLEFILKTEQNTLSHSQLIVQFKANRIKTIQFQNLKNLAKTNQLIDGFGDNDYDLIGDFQRYRNGFVHFSYNFVAGDYYDLKYDLIYYILNILTRVLINNSGLKPAEFYSEKLGQNYLKKLLHYNPFIKAMEKFAEINSSKVYYCLDCSNKTYSKDESICYCCNFDGKLNEYINCSVCMEDQSVIFDNLNIHLNNNIMTGLCLNCGNKTKVFKCPHCGISYDLSCSMGENICRNNFCANQ